ncbi:MAG: VanZ family protein [Candidatus Binatia bacterium]
MNDLVNQKEINTNNWWSRGWLWIPVLGYCAFIFLFSARSDLSPPRFPSSDKVAHMLEYSVLGFLWARAAKTSWPHWTPLLLLVSTCLFTGLYGASDEWHQSYVPGRFSDWRDAVADVCGGTLGGALYLFCLSFRNRSQDRGGSSQPSVVRLAENDE